MSVADSAARENAERPPDESAPGSDGARAVSTVLDAALFLLLVGAAVGLLVAAAPSEDEGGDVAAETATTVATSTTTVAYEPAAATTDWDEARRRDHGTLADLLASAAVASATVDDRPFAPQPAYVAAVREAVDREVAAVGAGASVQVRAVWEPVPGGDLGGNVTVGPTPPPDADVHAATVAVPLDASGAWGTERNLTRVAERDGYGALADALARSVVATVYPPARTAPVLDRTNPDRPVVVARYEATATAVGVSPAAVPLDGNATRTNRLLADALSDRIEADLRERYDSPTAAASAAAPAEVTVVVRTWS